ncbi:helix-turn-helix transcriptional regulator [Azohydromonas lata]|uniref:WYL domain-containing protein n=1 Tax=Azohydromonas lata TaxID=45677 RepID=A0ABU5I854_9BURK|nr:WYL domain-containing protein [Azohydromonas lata]MDZ5455269.1 WYL domain-containing protein [Azohydromonas lata]
MDRNFKRLLDLLLLLPRTGRLSTSQLRERLVARGYEVTARTVQRDLEELAQAYPIECDARSRPYGWSWRAGSPRLSLSGMDWAEAVSFQMLATYLDGVLPPSVMESLQPYVSEARSKLEQHFHDLPLRRWPERVRIVAPGPAGIPPKVSKSVHATLTEAVLLGRQVRITYQRFGQEKGKQYAVSPLGLVQFGQCLYLPVRFDGHVDVRTVKMHRVQRAEMLDRPSGIENFDLSAWIESGAMGFGGNKLIHLVVRLFDGAAEWVQESPLSLDQTLVNEYAGVYLLKSTVMETVQLRRWLLGLGPRVEVVEPIELRDELAREVQRTADRYEINKVCQLSATDLPN